MKVYWTDFASRCLSEIYFHYRKNAGEKVAKRIKSEIFLKVNSLKTYPNLGQIEPFLDETGLGHRHLISGNFQIIYLQQSGNIFITDLFDTRQNPEKINDPER